MTERGAKAAPKRVEIEAQVIRADGTVEDLGTVSSSDWKPWKPWTLAAKLKADKRIREANKKAT